MLQNKTKQDDTYLDLESPLLDDDRERSSAVDVEDQPEETGEPFWLKLLSCVGGVFPIVRANGKCYCNCANIAWSIWPFVLLSLCSVVLVKNVVSLFHSLTLNTLSYGLVFTFLFVLPSTLSYTRKSFSEAISGEEVYVNTLAKRGLILSVVGGSIYAGIFIGLGDIVGGIINLLYATSICSTISVVILRCIFLTHTQSSQQNTLLELVQGANVQSFQTKLLENCVLVEKASAYLQAPLGVCFTLGTANLGMLCLLLYLGSAYSVLLNVTFIVALALVVFTPLWVLTRIDKQYMWTLRNLLCRNTAMLDTEHSRLLLAYDTIAPRASLFDVYITRGRVSTLAIAFVGALVPKLVNYLMTLKV